MKLFDGHCDTAYELLKRGEGLARNSCHIDLQLSLIHISEPTRP